MKNINYSKATIKHFLDIARLDRVAWKDDPDSKYIPDGEHAWRLWVEHAYVYIATINNDIIGACLAFPLNNGDYCV
ncbi:N-acetyltransferase GCN5, partial [Candidatus Magnetomorum sp. HK-1]